MSTIDRGRDPALPRAVAATAPPSVPVPSVPSAVRPAVPLSTGDPVDGRTGPDRRSAIGGWAAAAGVYVLAVLHRSSLGVAGLQAEHRFGISPGALSVFVLLQLGVYAAMQIPTGILVDRLGPRRLLIIAAAVMAAAQLLFSIAPNYPMALLARAALGCGDALTFVSVLRFSSSRFSPRHYPIVVSATSLLGGIGSLAATLPLSIALADVGWTPTFASAGALSLVAGAVVWLVLPRTDVPAANLLGLGAMRAKTARVGRRVVAAWTHPGTRLGFWVHFSCMSATTTFNVLWGFPYLVTGLGFSRAAAGSALLASVACSLAASVVVGTVISRRPGVRVPLAVGTCVLTMLGWLVLIALPPDAVPRGYVLSLVCAMAAGGPVSSIAFALARDYNRPAVLGTATGVVNVGGFVSTIITALLIGGVLDVMGSTPTGYRVAMIALVGVQLFGTVQLVRWWRRARNFVLHEQSKGYPTPVTLVRHRFDLG